VRRATLIFPRTRLVFLSILAATAAAAACAARTRETVPAPPSSTGDASAARKAGVEEARKGASDRAAALARSAAAVEADPCVDSPTLPAGACSSVSYSPLSIPSRGWTHPIYCPCGQRNGRWAWHASCYTRAFQNTDGGERLWIPPSPPPSVDESGLVSYACTWPWPSVGTRPIDLLLVLVRLDPVEYGINLFQDGRFIIQSQRCPHDLTPEYGHISKETVDMLRAAARSAGLERHDGCLEPTADATPILLAMYDLGQEKVLFDADRIDMISKFADLMDRTLRTGEWIERKFSR
jgi:hypothetical protein